jgi:hypothetical protein
MLRGKSMRALRGICQGAGQAFLGGIGASRLKATGDIYQRARVSDLAGVYRQVCLGWALPDQDNGRLLLQNGKGGVLKLRTVRQDLMLAADAVRNQFR